MKATVLKALYPYIHKPSLEEEMVETRFSIGNRWTTKIKCVYTHLHLTSVVYSLIKIGVRYDLEFEGYYENGQCFKDQKPSG